MMPMLPDTVDLAKPAVWRQVEEDLERFIPFNSGLMLEALVSQAQNALNSKH